MEGQSNSTVYLELVIISSGSRCRRTLADSLGLSVQVKYYEHLGQSSSLIDSVTSSRRDDAVLPCMDPCMQLLIHLDTKVRARSLPF